MDEVGIRALKQNASAVAQRVAAGASVTITDRGRPVARMSPIPTSRLDEFRASGQARAPLIPFSSIPRPEPGPAISAELERMRDEERW